MVERKIVSVKVKLGEPEHHIYIPVTIGDKESKLHYMVDNNERLIKAEETIDNMKDKLVECLEHKFTELEKVIPACHGVDVCDIKEKRGKLINASSLQSIEKEFVGLKTELLNQQFNMRNNLANALLKKYKDYQEIDQEQIYYMCDKLLKKKDVDIIYYNLFHYGDMNEETKGNTSEYIKEYINHYIKCRELYELVNWNKAINILANKEDK